MLGSTEITATSPAGTTQQAGRIELAEPARPSGGFDLDHAEACLRIGGAPALAHEQADRVALFHEIHGSARSQVEPGEDFLRDGEQAVFGDDGLARGRTGAAFTHLALPLGFRAQAGRLRGVDGNDPGHRPAMGGDDIGRALFAHPAEHLRELAIGFGGGNGSGHDDSKYSYIYYFQTLR